MNNLDSNNENILVVNDEINLIEEELWDHYSGLPNPLWYKYKNSLSDNNHDNFGDIKKIIENE
jgi:hypothetical protein